MLELAAQDGGQGAPTALGQIAAESLGLELDQLEFWDGSLSLPDAGITADSSHAATAFTAPTPACRRSRLF